MKVLVVSNGYPPRGGFGTEFYTRELVRGLARRGHAVSVLHPERSGARERFTVERVEEDGVPLALLHNPGDADKRFATSYRDERVERQALAIELNHTNGAPRTANGEPNLSAPTPRTADGHPDLSGTWEPVKTYSRDLAQDLRAWLKPRAVRYYPSRGVAYESHLTPPPHLVGLRVQRSERALTVLRCGAR